MTQVTILLMVLSIVWIPAAYGQLNEGLTRRLDEMASVQNASLLHLKTLDARLDNIIASLNTLLAAKPKCSGWCPAGWRRVHDHCYLLSDHTTTWYDAQTACEDLTHGGHLASVHAETLSAVNAIIASSGHPDIWLGLRRTRDDEGWAWSDGSGLDITNWLHGQPDNPGVKASSSTSNCVGSTSSGQWFDYPCAHPFHYMCQVEAA